MRFKRYRRGFSLVESAISLVVLGLLATALLAWWKTAGQAQVAAAERDVLEQAEAALVGFAHASYRLPCPAADGDGIENCDNGAQIGFLPWRTLGVYHPQMREMRYGVYRQPDASSLWRDADLAAARDRFRPLLAAGTPPAGMESPLGHSNALDFCYALNVASTAAANPAALNTVELDAAGKNAPATRRNVAFALAMPGLLDADGDGDRFDGNQHAQSAASPAFDAPARRHGVNYDDRVRAMAFQTLFASLSCGQALAAAGHAHFNAAGGAMFMKQGLADYKDQLDLAALAAGAGVADAVAQSVSAVAGMTGAVADVGVAIAEAIFSYGAYSAVIGPAVASLLFNAAAVYMSVPTMAAAIAAKAIADENAENVKPLVKRAADLATGSAYPPGVDSNARNADAAGL